MSYITITTNQETAKALQHHCNEEQRLGTLRSFQLKGVRHEKNHSVVVLEPSHDNKEIDLSDIFFLGYYTCLSI